MAGSDLEARLAHVARTCVALRWELSSILGDGDRIPVDLVLALQLLDGKAELATQCLKRHLDADGDGSFAVHKSVDVDLIPPPAPPTTVISVVDRISRL